MIVPYTGGTGTDPDAIHTKAPGANTKKIEFFWLDELTGLPNFEVEV